MTGPRLLLASASTARLAVLRAAGIEPLVRVSDVDEETLLKEAEAGRGPLLAAQQALTLARAKAEAVHASLGDAPWETADFVLGCDSMLEIDHVAYGKPTSAADARERWQFMSGRSGILHTGHCLIDVRSERGAPVSRAVATKVEFAHLSPEEIDAYVASGEPLGCAGAFTIDGLAGPFITRLEGDHLNVLGLSLPELRSMFHTYGVSWPSLWNRPTDHL